MAGTPSTDWAHGAMNYESTAPAVIRTPDYRLRVFISSTLRELAEEREAVRQAVLKLHLVPVLFESGARPHPARNLYEAYVAQSHVFIGIYWERYGWIAPGMRISGLEDEYRLSADKPRLIYIREPGPNRQPELAAMLDRIRAEGLTSYKRFGSPRQLADLVENDLALLLTERFEAIQASAPPHNGVGPRASVLPMPRKAMIGREHQLAAAERLFSSDEVALVTLTGPAGIGKSRLALQIALDVEPAFADGVYLVMLESVDGAELVIPAIARALQIPQSADSEPLAGTVAKYLCGKQVLLVLDNFEHVLAAAPKVADLLESCPKVKILATSRAPLRLRAENVMPVPPLSFPPAGEFPSLERLWEYPAVRLFVQRAQAVKPDFLLTDANSAAVSEICRRLDGLPLAIELAAARTTFLSPHGVVDRIGKRFDLLRGGSRDLPQRQRTLYDAIEWSYVLLDADQQRLLRNLSVLAGAWTTNAASAIGCGDDDERRQLFTRLEALVESNLLKAPYELEGQLRLGMFESIRAFGQQRLIESGGLQVVRQRHLAYFRDVVHRAEAELMGGQQLRWQRWLTSDLENIRQAMQWALDSGHPDTVLQMTASLGRFWDVHGYWREGVQWIERGLAAESSDVNAATAAALARSGLMRARLGKFARALGDLERSVEIWRQIGDAVGLGAALSTLGIAMVYGQDFDRASAYLEESIELQSRAGDQRQLYLSWLNLGIAAFSRGENDRALGLYRQALEASRAADDCATIGLTLLNLGELYRELGSWPAADSSLDQAESEFSSLGDRVRVALAIGERGMVRLRMGNSSAALDLLSKSLRSLQALDQKDYVLAAIEKLATVACARNERAQAVLLLSAAASLRTAAGLASWPADQRNSQQCLLEARSQLDPEAFRLAWEAGSQLTVDAAVAEALGEDRKS